MRWAPTDEEFSARIAAFNGEEAQQRRPGKAVSTANGKPHPAKDIGLVTGAAIELPELVITTSNPAATAKGLAELFAHEENFLSNGNAPVRIVVDADDMPRAVEVTPEAVRVYAHEICRPIKERKVKGGVEHVPSASAGTLRNCILTGSKVSGVCGFFVASPPRPS